MTVTCALPAGSIPTARKRKPNDSEVMAYDESTELIPSHHNRHTPMTEEYKLATGNCWPDNLSDYETLGTSPDDTDE